MGERIHFKRKGAVIKNGFAVSLNEPKVKYIKGVKTTPVTGQVECGDGTAYPLQVTLEELHQIVYQIRDFRFDGGGFTAAIDGSTDRVISAITAAPPTKLASSINESSDFDFSERTFLVCANDEDIDRASLDTEYTVNVAGVTDIDYRDFISEEAMWLGTPMPRNGGDLNPAATSLPFGLSFYQNTTGGYSAAPKFGIKSLVNGTTGDEIEAVCESNLQVAFTGSSPTDAAGELWLNLRFELFADDGLTGDFANTLAAGSLTYLADLIIKLAGGSSLSCKLYLSPIATSITDFTMQPVAWWPYAKEDGTPMYSATTGLPL